VTDQPVHGTTVARRTPAGWQGVVIMGPPGAGKSDLALKLIGQGWRLVGDDYSHLWISGGALYARAPDTIYGRIEIRGLGVRPMGARHVCRIALAIQCAPATAVERMPDPSSFTWNGVAVPQLVLDPRPASAVHVVASALDGL
jgi:serine kinase of HPr protein (carbohydrate metabolism regulator)